MNAFYLRHFFDVVRMGGFSRAAQEINLSQPNMSRSVRLLEAELGVVLMKRSKSGIDLTEEGKVVYASAKEVFEKLDQLKSKLTGKASDRTIRIGASENLCLYKMPKLVKELMKGRQCATVGLFSGTSEQIEEKILNFSVDFGIFYHPPKSAPLKQKVMGEIEFKLIYPMSCLKAGRSLDLTSLPFVGSRTSDYSKPYFALSALQRHGIRPSVIIETNSQETQLRMVREGLGYSVVPEFMLKGSEKKLKIDSNFSAKSKLFVVSRASIDPKLIQSVSKAIFKV